MQMVPYVEPFSSLTFPLPNGKDGSTYGKKYAYTCVKNEKNVNTNVLEKSMFSTMVIRSLLKFIFQVFNFKKLAVVMLNVVISYRQQLILFKTFGSCYNCVVVVK